MSTISPRTTALETHTLVLGGARSGKTRHALDLAESRGAAVYVATAQAFDEEMADRIARHRAERGDQWRTLEAPLDLCGALDAAAALNGANAVVVDCLTLWLSNLILAERDPEPETAALCARLAAISIPTVLVSNEVGLGIVPDNALARRFRDAQGRLNQAVAAVVPRVVFVAAGLPLVMKG